MKEKQAIKPNWMFHKQNHPGSEFALKWQNAGNYKLVSDNSSQAPLHKGLAALLMTHFVSNFLNFNTLFLFCCRIWDIFYQAADKPQSRGRLECLEGKQWRFCDVLGNNLWQVLLHWAPKAPGKPHYSRAQVAWETSTVIYYLFKMKSTVTFHSWQNTPFPVQVSKW